MIGDIAISAEYADKQAKLRKVPIQDELAYLVIHGGLHLCGFDDVEDADRKIMQQQMAAMGDKVGLIPDPHWSSLLHQEKERVLDGS
jgi:rRNA maturation RNase YbeY